jgi:hypothetical protein
VLPAKSVAPVITPPETFGPRVAAVAGAASASATSTAARSFIRRFSNAEPEAST